MNKFKTHRSLLDSSIVLFLMASFVFVGVNLLTESSAAESLKACDTKNREQLVYAIRNAASSLLLRLGSGDIKTVTKLPYINEPSYLESVLGCSQFTMTTSEVTSSYEALYTEATAALPEHVGRLVSVINPPSAVTASSNYFKAVFDLRKVDDPSMMLETMRAMTDDDVKKLAVNGFFQGFELHNRLLRYGLVDALTSMVLDKLKSPEDFFRAMHGASFYSEAQVSIKTIGMLQKIISSEKKMPVDVICRSLDAGAISLSLLQGTPASADLKSAISGLIKKTEKMSETANATCVRGGATAQLSMLLEVARDQIGESRTVTRVRKVARPRRPVAPVSSSSAYCSRKHFELSARAAMIELQKSDYVGGLKPQDGCSITISIARLATRELMVSVSVLHPAWRTSESEITASENLETAFSRVAERLPLR